MAQIQQDRVRCRLLHTLLVASLLVVNTVYAVVDSAEGSDVASVATATEDAAMVLGSQCSITTGCPRSSMAWASGSFTEDGVLTPQALALDTQLTLQISLCCGYLFHGGMLENSANGEEMYDVFLETLLHATPLRIFSADEKRKLFPRSAAVIGNTANGKKYSTVVRADDDEVAFGNDGDGDVLILTTGAIDAAAFRIPFKSIATKPTGTSSRKSDTNNNIAEVGESDETGDEAYDMQLLLSNRVLKCKCPHTLHVMPMLYLKRDRVPALRLRGGGARCVTSADILVVSSDDLVDTDAPAPSPTVQHSFTSVAKIPPFSYVVWEVYNTHPSWNGPRNGAGHHHQRHSKGVVADPLSTVLPVLVHRRWTTVGLPKNSASRHEDHPHDLQGTTLSEDGMNFTFPAHLHTRYRVSLRVVKGSATGETSDRLVLRAKVLEFWTTVSYPLQPFVGYRYAAVVRTAASLVNDDTAVNRPEDVQLLRDIVFSSVGRDDGDYHTRWIVTNSNDAAAAPAIPLFGVNTTKVPVQRGRQVVSFIVVDSDEACPPVTVEQHNVFAIQLLITSPTPSPFTACTNETRLEARDERPLLASDLRRQLLASQLPPVTSGNANYSQLWFHNVEVDAEQWHCSFIPQRSALELTTADALRDTNKIASPCIMAPSSATRIASLDTRDPVVTAVQWRLRLRFSRRTASPAEQSTALVHALEEQLIETAWYGGVVESSSLTLLLDAYSPPLLIYRRTAALPVEVDVYLPMHALSYNVSAPNVIVRGRWAARSPLSLRTSPNAAVVTLGTALVPNIQQTLPRGTLQFIVADPGEMVSISRALLGWLLEHRRTPRQVAVPLTTEPIPVLGDVHDARSAAVSTTADSTSVSFIARCPDAAVEYRIHVVAFPPEAVVPAHELIVTEDAVLTLRAPRPPAKGEEISWTVENCTSDAVPTEMVVVLTSADTGALLSGIHPHMHCDVRWTALNVAGAAYKVFSIRRCEKPPALKFFTTAGTTGRAQITPVLRRRNAASLQFDETELTLSTFDDPSLVLVLPFAGMNMTTVVSFEAESARSRFSTEWTAMNSWVLSGFLHKQYATSSSSAMHQSLWDSMSWVPQSSLVISSASPQQESSSADNEAGSFSGIETLINFNATQRGLLTHIQFIEAVAPQWMAEPYATDAQLLFPPYGMCPPRLGHIFTLHVTPLDLVPPTSVDKETNLPVLEMCAETMLLARHPSLHDVYGYSWAWSCAKSFDELLLGAAATESQDSSSPILVEPIPDRHLQHLFHRNRNVNAVGGDVEPRAYCTMRLINTISATEASTTYLVVGVKPSVFTSAVIRSNITSINRYVPGAVDQSMSTTRKAAAVPTSGVGVRVPSPIPTPRRTAQQEPQLFKPTQGMLSFVGPAATLHLSPPASERPVGYESEEELQELVRWSATAVTPQYRSSSEYRGTALLLANISFEDRPNTAEISVKYGSGGVTVNMQGFSLPGVYTILYSQHDPAHPLSCPPVSFTQLLHVYRAQVVTDTIVVCHSEAEVRAVPLPRELQRDFYALWEIVSREDELSLAGAGPLTSGADLAGMRFDMSARPETRITGLPFGIVTIRWAIYKNVKEGDDDVLVGTTTMGATNGSSNIVLRRVLVDEARVTLFVLTENLRSNRVVTLADAIDVPITSSTHQWRFAETGTQQGPSSGGVLARSSSLSFRYINQSLSRAATPAGSAVMSVRQLRVGVTRLYYELRPSLRIAFIERLKNLTCPVAPATSLFEVERVTAFLSLKNISGHHECDAYFQNRVNFTLCLEAGDRTTAQFFAERVALIDAEKMERIVKSDATAFAASVGCSVPWWASEDAAEWTSVYAFEDQRCFFFAARAKRHLSSREAAHPLLEAAAFPRGSLGGADSVNFAECPAGLDIFSARLVEGVDFVSPAGGQGMKPFLPILEPSSLRPPTALLRAGLRPLIGFDAREDDVASETQLAMESPTAASVTLQLDHTQASLPYSAAPLLPTDDVSSTAPRPPVTILDKCLDNTLTADDVVALWAPTEGGGSSVAVNPLVAQRWRDYVTQAGGKHVVRCEPLWPSLDHMLPRPQDTLETLATRRAQVFPPNRQELVTLAALEDQLSALNRSHYWTRDGIEVTGLSPELANALLRKKVTAKQFEEIQRHRATQAQQQHAQLHSAPIHTIDNAEGTVFLSTHNNEDASVAIPASQRRRRFEEALAVLQSWREAHKLPRPAVSLPGPYRTDSPIVALRVMLPAAPRFVAPANFAVRMVLSKDVVCGSSVRHDSPQVSSQPPPPTAATVVFQRLVIRDEPPVINVAPLRVKQCDVEGALPPIVIRLENIGFADEVVNFTFADWRARIELTELENLNVTALLAMEGNRHAYSDNIVGLKPCLGTLLRGARVTLDSKTSQKILQLQFAPCPQFLMLSNEEYNERQEGDVLLARLQHPRYFKVVVRNVVGRDSFTYSTTASSAPSSEVATTYVSAETVSFTITVAPTLVRLHVRPGGHHLQGEDFVTFHDSPSLPPAATAPQQLVVAGAAMICESAMKHDGFELGFELVGDHWHYAVGRSFLSISNNNGDEATPIMQPNDEDYQEAQVVLSQSRRTQQDVSLLNAFSLVEHHILDAATYAFLYIGGGHYQSHFVHYLFGSVLRDAVGSMNDAQQRTLVQSNRKDTENGGDVDDNSYAARQKFVHRYNDTFIGLRLPAASSNSDAKTPKHRHVGNNNMLPPSLEFNTIEEILFAVPGITTKCKGCLLADRTFFVAGDGSGIFSVGTSGAGALAARKLSAPFEIPFDGFLSAPRTIAYEWLCAFTASSFAQQVLRKYTPPTKSLHSLLGSAYFVVDVFVLSPRDELGRTLPLASQPRKVVSSLPAAVEGNSITRFSFSEQALEFAVDVLASDYTGKYLKPHLKPVFDYHVLPNGAVAVNATTTLSLCIAPPPNAPGGSGNDCTVLYYKPSRLLVDRRGQVAASILSSSWLQPEVLVHHAVTVCVFRWSQVQGASRPSLFMPALLAASLFVFSATIPVVAIGMWLLVWADVFRRQAGLWPVAFFGLHGLMYAIGAARRV